MPDGRTAIEIVEYGPPAQVIGRIAGALGISTAAAEQKLRELGERLARAHSMERNPIQIVGKGVRALGIAGITNLGRGVELHIRPKFAGSTDEWQEDLLFLTLFTSYGHLDPLHRIVTRSGVENTLAELAARVLLGMITRNHRLPLKVRRRRVTHSFEPSGEIDPDILLNPTDEGWEQIVYEMSRDNEYWSTIHRGAMAVLPHVRDAHIATTLSNTVRRWGVPTAAPSMIRAKLPPRLAAWQGAYDLAYELGRSSGFAPAAGRFTGFEFTLNTWRMWQALIDRALVMSFGADRVSLQPAHAIGKSSRAGREVGIDVHPDAVLSDERGPLVVDAKYKGRGDKGFTGITPADRYEAMAFMQAVKSSRATLVMPSLTATHVGEPSILLQVDRLPTGSLVAVAIGVRGIAKSSGIRKFSATLRSAIQTIADTETALQGQSQA